MVIELITCKGECNNISAREGMEHNPHLKKLSYQTIFFSDSEIASAAILAYHRSLGTLKTITHTDIYDTLGIARGSRIWEERDNIVSSRRLSLLLKRYGFVSVNSRHCGRKARYIRINSGSEAGIGVC